MSKSIKWIIGIVVVILIGTVCFLFGKQTAMTSSLFVEDGLVKYNNNGVTEEVLSLEELFTKEDNTTVVNGKEVEFSVQDGYIVWNYVGETKINKLIAIEELVGKQGENGTDGKDGINGVDGKDGSDGKDGTNGIDGKDGKSAYICVKYLDNAPESSEDSELKDEASSYMGIYYGANAIAPTDISSYKWYAVKGEKGEKGDKGDTGAQGIQGEKGDKGEKGESGTNGKDGSISEMIVFEGLITSETTGTQISLIPDTILYKKGESISINNLTKNVELESGTYLITIDGYGVFNTSNTTLNFVVDHKASKDYYPAKLSQDSNTLCNFSFTKCCVVGETDFSKQIRLYAETNTTSLNSIKYTVSIMKLI